MFEDRELRCVLPSDGSVAERTEELNVPMLLCHRPLLFRVAAAFFAIRDRAAWFFPAFAIRAAERFPSLPLILS
jgi:hypothetical protein